MGYVFSKAIGMFCWKKRVAIDPLFLLKFKDNILFSIPSFGRDSFYLLYVLERYFVNRLCRLVYRIMSSVADNRND